MDLKPLITLLAIVNPLAIVPFFIHYTQGFSYPQRRRTIQVASFSVFCVIAACALLGLQILDFFNISLQSFQVGGGMLLLISAMNMLNAQPAEAKPSTNEYEEGAEKAAAGSSISGRRPGQSPFVRPRTGCRHSAMPPHPPHTHARTSARPRTPERATTLRYFGTLR